MAIVKKGDALTTNFGELQAGWTIENDGYGLLTCRAEYIRNDNLSFINATTVKNSVFEKDNRLYGHKFSWSKISLQRWKVTIDYVGIDTSQPNTVTDNWTQPQTFGNNGLSTEKIETHPNFFEKTIGTNIGSDTAIAGKFSDLNQTSLIVGKGVNYMEGFNGAIFEPSATTNRTGKFVGFYRDDKPQFYGKTSYLAPSTVFSGIVYTDIAANATAFKNALGVALNTNNLDIASAPAFIPVEFGTSWNGSSGPQLLVSKVDIENYGPLWKISYEVRYSREGFPKVVYPKIV